MEIIPRARLAYVWKSEKGYTSILEEVFVDILMAVPHPLEMDGEKVKEMVPIGRKTVRAVEGGMITQGLCVDRFGPECDQIVVANTSITVSVDR